MNYKIISVILICSFLLLCFSGCSLIDNMLAKKDVDADSNITKENEAPTEYPTEFTGIPIEKDSELISSIVDFLYNKHADHMMTSSGLPAKIHKIKSGEAQLLEIAFDPFEYYFVCGYDSNTNGSFDGYDEERAKNCNWFRFDSADEIPEYYNGEKCAFAFQFNAASSAVNIFDVTDVTETHHFLEYKPKFEQGFNVNLPIAFDETILILDGVYFNSLNKDVAYYSTASFFDPWTTIRLIEIDGVKYLTLNRYKNKDEVATLEMLLEEYYEDFVRVAEIDEYEKYFPDSTTSIVSLVSFDNFVKAVKELQ